MQPPVDGVPVQHVLRSVHRHGVQLALRFRRLDQRQRSKAHLPTSATFRAQPRGLVSGQLSRQPAEVPAMTPWFPVAFRPPAFACWASCSRRGVPLPSRSAYQATSAWTRRDFHVPHIRVTAGLGALFTPEPSGAHTAGPIPPAAARPLYQGPGLITPACIPSPGLSITRRHQGFIRIHPPGLPPCLWSPDGSRTSWACSPGFAPQQAGPAAHARAGDGHRALARSYTTDTVGPPIHELTRNVRPRVARSVWTCPASPPRPTCARGPASPPGSRNRPARRRAAAPPGTAAPTWPGSWARPPWPPPRPTPSSANAIDASPDAVGRRKPSSRSAARSWSSSGSCCLTPGPGSMTSEPSSTTTGPAPTARNATTSGNSRPSATRSPSNPQPDHRFARHATGTVTDRPELLPAVAPLDELARALGPAPQRPDDL